MINLNNFSKKGQSEIIITVLLILIGIAAVGFVGVFVTNMVRNNLQQTDCFKTNGQLSLNLEYTFFNLSNKVVYISVARGSANFNLTGLLVNYGTAQGSKGITIDSGKVGNIKDGFAMLDNAGGILATNMTMPGLGETTSYAINASTYSAVNLISITPVLVGGKVCENKADEKSITTVQ